MEQERKIEKWLKAYAKKRRGQAGGPLKLDPAARQMLQNEISRSAPASEDDDATMSLWELLRKHWLYLLGFATCVFVLAALFLPNMYAPIARSFSESSTLSLARDKKQIPAAIRQPVEGATTSLTPPPPAVASDNSSRTADVPPAPEMVPPAPPPPTLGMSGAAHEPDNAAPESGALSPPAAAAPIATRGEVAMNSMPANSLPGGAPRGEISKTLGGGGGVLNGRAARNDYLETSATPSQSAAVLVNFQVSQNGNTIRVVDEDGSVYTGSLEPEGGQNLTAAATARLTNLATVNMSALNTTTRKSESPKIAQFDSVGANSEKENYASPPPGAISSGLQQAAKEPSVAAEPQAPMQKYSFYVEGTNQTLKQSVVFAGTLLEDLSFASNARQTFGMSANAALGAAYAQQFVRAAMTNQPLRIEGIAIIDQTYKIQINAAPVPAKNSSPPK